MSKVGKQNGVPQGAGAMGAQSVWMLDCIPVVIWNACSRLPHVDPLPPRVAAPPPSPGRHGPTRWCALSAPAPCTPPPAAPAAGTPSSGVAHRSLAVSVSQSVSLCSLGRFCVLWTPGIMRRCIGLFVCLLNPALLLLFFGQVFPSKPRCRGLLRVRRVRHEQASFDRRVSGVNWEVFLFGAFTALGEPRHIPTQPPPPSPEVFLILHQALPVGVFIVLFFLRFAFFSTIF